MSIMEKYEHAKIEALYNVLSEQESYIYRQICRYVSTKFNMALDRVESMPFNYVMRNYYESIYENQDKNELIDKAIQMMCPEVAANEEENLQDFIKQLEEQEAKKASNKKNTRKEVVQKELPDMPEEIDGVKIEDIPKLPEFNMKFDEDLV
jgi:uncharacterized membrane-anchored protein YjiN (DUF445 family)